MTYGEKVCAGLDGMAGNSQVISLRKCRPRHETLPTVRPEPTLQLMDTAELKKPAVFEPPAWRTSIDGIYTLEWPWYIDTPFRGSAFVLTEGKVEVAKLHNNGVLVARPTFTWDGASWPLPWQTHASRCFSLPHDIFYRAMKRRQLDLELRRDVDTWCVWAVGRTAGLWLPTCHLVEWVLHREMFGGRAARPDLNDESIHRG